jgi:Peptidase family M28
MAAPLPPVRQRRRPRRGSIERPVDGRLYRRAFLVAALPLVLAAFTMVRPSSLPAPLLPTTFDGPGAVQLANSFAREVPDRVPGTIGGVAAASWVRTELAAEGYTAHTSAWHETVAGLGDVGLRNVWAIARGTSPDVIVVMAHHDDTGAGPGANDNATGTAALIELARSYAQPASLAQPASPSVHTIVFLSTDAGAYGGVGAARFLHTWPRRNRIIAVVNLDALGGSGPPSIQIAGFRPFSPAAILLQTTATRILAATGHWPSHPSALGQLIDLGFPFTLYEQGSFLGSAIPAVTITTGGERPPPAFGDTLKRLHAKRFAELGLASRQLLATLDQGLEGRKPTPSIVWVGRRLVRGWTVELTLIALLVPYLVGTVDLFAFCRRRRIPLAPAFRSLRTRLWLWLFVGLCFELLRALGAWPQGAPLPPNPALPVAGDWPVLPLVVLIAAAAGAWLLARPRLVPRRAVDAEATIAGEAAALLALAVVSLAITALNPFALLFALPALHIWLWLPSLRRAAVPVRLAAFVTGLSGPLLVIASLAWRFGLGFDAPWYLLELVGLGFITTLPVVIVLAGTAAAAQLAAAAAGRYAPYPDASERGRGPFRALVRTAVLANRRRRAAA